MLGLICDPPLLLMRMWLSRTPQAQAAVIPVLLCASLAVMEDVEKSAAGSAPLDAIAAEALGGASRCIISLCSIGSQADACEPHTLRPGRNCWPRLSPCSPGSAHARAQVPLHTGCLCVEKRGTQGLTEGVLRSSELSPE